MQNVTTWLEARGLRPVNALFRALQAELSQDQEHDSAFLQEKAAEKIAGFAIQLHGLILEDPALLPILRAELTTLHREAKKRAEGQEQEASRLEAPAGRQVLRFFGVNMDHPVKEIIGLGIDEAQRQRLLKTQRRLAIAQTAVQIYAALLQRLDWLEKQLPAMDVVIKALADRSRQEIDDLAKSIVRSALPNDLSESARILTACAESLAMELGEMQQLFGRQALSASLEKYANQPLPVQTLADELFVRGKETGSRVRDQLPRSIPDVIALITGDVPTGMRALLDDLQAKGFPAMPAVPLTPAAARESMSVHFQVVNAHSMLLVRNGTGKIERLPAYFAEEVSNPAFALVRVELEFPLSGVEAVASLESVLASAAANANPFLLPELAAKYQPAAPPPPPPAEPNVMDQEWRTDPGVPLPAANGHVDSSAVPAGQ